MFFRKLFTFTLAYFSISINAMLTLFLPHAFAIDLEKLDYEDTRDVVRLIWKDLPRDKYVYMGAGRSPTNVIALMQELDPQAVAFNFPITDLYARPEPSEGYDPPLTREEEERFIEHCRRFLPPREVIGNRSILHIDFVIGGKSAVAQEEYIRRCLDVLMPDVKLEVALLTGNLELEEVRKARKNYHIIDIRPYRVLNNRMAFFYYLDHAEFDGFKPPFFNSADLLPRPEYQRLRTKLRGYVRSDATSDCDDSFR